MDCSLPASSVHGISQARILGWVAISFPRGPSLPNSGIEPMSPAMAGGSFTTEPPGKPSRREFYSSKTEDYSPGGSLSIVPRNCSAEAWSSVLHLVRTKNIHQTWEGYIHEVVITYTASQQDPGVWKGNLKFGGVVVCVGLCWCGHHSTERIHPYLQSILANG